MDIELHCQACGGVTSAMAPEGWRCDCGGPWELPPGPPFDRDAIDAAAPGLWRYGAQVRLPRTARLSLGEGGGAWVRLRDGPLVACAHLQPTLSFKALGAATLVAWARLAATPPLIEDSSGNAGGAVAAYAAAAGLACRVYVPAAAPPPKRRMLEVFGAEVVAVEGPRPCATEAARSDRDGTYCSHAWNPWFLEGVRTLAFFWWEKNGGRFPARVYVPAGQGSLVIGLWRGFGELAAGVPGVRPPALIAVQHRDFAPLYATWRSSVAAGPAGETEPAGKETGSTAAPAKTPPATTPPGTTPPETTPGGGHPGREPLASERRTAGLEDVAPSRAVPLADGIVIADPVRRGEALAAVRASGGEVRVVDDEEIRAAMSELAGNGLWVEPTAAVALAGQRQVGDDEAALVVLTGHGLKTAT